MASVKELRLRITSVGNIQQITRAMEMVATTKLRRFQDRAIASRPYTEEIAGLVSHLAGVLGDEVQDNPLFRKGTGSKTGVLLVTSDRGLCGAYNSNLFSDLEGWMSEREAEDVDFFVYGKKGYSYLNSRGYNVERFIVEPPLESVDFGQAARTAQTLVDAFLSGDYADVYIYYTAFQSMVRYTPTAVQLLPLEAGGEDESEQTGGDLILEPDAETIFESLIPRYLEVRVYNALLEALTSEYASRRMSMKNATDAASDMIKMLKGRYNRLRQENVTKDLLDIVGGAEALR
ncbi:MAG: ATP synthase F1 subunit gamma [Planctomycetes bacterium]|nr:ATP synthase F1 subunit gamma [Planctomycetota bacterium]